MICKLFCDGMEANGVDVTIDDDDGSGIRTGYFEWPNPGTVPKSSVVELQPSGGEKIRITVTSVSPHSTFYFSVVATLWPK